MFIDPCWFHVLKLANYRTWSVDNFFVLLSFLWWLISCLISALLRNQKKKKLLFLLSNHFALLRLPDISNDLLRPKPTSLNDLCTNFFRYATNSIDLYLKRSIQQNDELQLTKRTLNGRYVSTISQSSNSKSQSN